jgi:hypothetical protein
MHAHKPGFISVNMRKRVRETLVYEGERMKFFAGVVLMCFLTSPAIAAKGPGTQATPAGANGHAVKQIDTKRKAAGKTAAAKSTLLNGPTGAGKPGTGGPGASAGTNSNGTNGPNGPVSGNH